MRLPRRRRSANCLTKLKPSFPDGVDYKVTYDTTKFVEESIHEVIKTLIEAFILVVIVVYLFLGSVRATLIPLIAVPVSLIGTFAVMMALGSSANTVSLLALVLAIGIVVDDAIVVVEAVRPSWKRTRALRRLRPRGLPWARSRHRLSPSHWCCCRSSSRCAFIPGISGELFPPVRGGRFRSRW